MDIGKLLTQAQLKKHVELQTFTHADPRKNPRPRKRLKTDASTGRGFFFQDKGAKISYVTYEPDISTTRSVYNRMRDLGVHPGTEPWNLFHARLVEEKRVKDEKRFLV